MTDLLSWFLAWRLPSTSLHCVIMQFGYVQKTRVLPSETLPPNLDIENFCHRVDHVNKTRRLSSLFTTPAMVDVVAIYYTMVDRNPLSPLLWFVVQLVPTVMQQLTRFRLSHCPSAVAKLLVHVCYLSCQQTCSIRALQQWWKCKPLTANNCLAYHWSSLNYSPTFGWSGSYFITWTTLKIHDWLIGW